MGGGSSQLNCFVSVEAEFNDVWAIDLFYSLTTDGPYCINLKNAMQTYGPRIGDNCLPIACDGGDNQIFLNFKFQPAKVQLCIHDECFKIIDVANCFEDFIDRLYLEPELDF
ncbi:MAG: hypothetical protein JEZ07_00785 [Phycisphaerae bacterium]|nr:hypothetical protein [Phycisphaerae bacterium]